MIRRIVFVDSAEFEEAKMKTKPSFSLCISKLFLNKDTLSVRRKVSHTHEEYRLKTLKVVTGGSDEFACVPNYVDPLVLSHVGSLISCWADRCH